MATTVFDVFRKLKTLDLVKERKYLKAREKFLSVSSKYNINYKTATKEQLDLIRGTLEKERKKELANSMYTMIVTILVTFIVYYVVSLVFGKS